ncbi:hypothetical protein VTK26DRAFT_206 [Humicola hyalothermophila]
MPYDPDWVPDLAVNGTPSYEANVQNGTQAEEMQEEYIGDFEMEVDSGSPQPAPRELENGEDKALHPKPPFPAGASPTKRSLLEVVLRSSPRRDGFTTTNNPSEGYVDADPVTSDLVPQARNKQPEVLAADAPTASPGKQQTAVVTATQVPPVTPQPKKKRGRPFGWRLGSGPYSLMTGGTPTPRPPKPKQPVSEQNPRGRRGRKPAPTARQIYLTLNPHFLTFRCEWENCPAELQNLETLRKHLLVVHGRSSSSSTPEQSLACKWANCALANPSPQTLTSKEAFAAHIETTHLPPFLWHIGDGPRNSSPSSSACTTTTTTSSSSSSLTPSRSSSPLPAYLFSPRGTTQVTPSVRDQRVESEDERKKRIARLHRVLARRDRNAVEEPLYAPAVLEEIAQFMSEKRARQRMLREYAERYGVGGRVGEGGAGVAGGSESGSWGKGGEKR